MTTILETFESGATRHATDYRYDLMPSSIIDTLLKHHEPARNFAETLQAYLQNEYLLGVLLNHLDAVVCPGVLNPSVAHFYAQALHEGAEKYGERNWEKGIPESNLLNHALYHLFQLVQGDKSENHQSHLVWNVLTLIHFRLQETRSQNDVGE